MGADLIIAMLPMRKTQDEAIAKLKSLTQDDLLDTLSNYHAREFDKETPEAEYAEAIEFMIGKIAEVYDYYEKGSRDTEVRTLDGTPWLITGGMSWGDDPTDAFESLNIVANFQLTDDEQIQIPTERTGEV
jgi:hypothetical protein